MKEILLTPEHVDLLLRLREQAAQIEQLAEASRAAASIATTLLVDAARHGVTLRTSTGAIVSCAPGGNKDDLDNLIVLRNTTTDAMATQDA